MSRSASTEDIHAHMLRRSGVPHMNTLRCLPENISCTDQREPCHLSAAHHGSTERQGRQLYIYHAGLHVGSLGTRAAMHGSTDGAGKGAAHM